MAGSRIPGPTGLTLVQPIDVGTLNRSATPAPNSVGLGPTHPDSPDPQVRELRELGFELVQLGLDLAGIVDPTPVSDGLSGLLALARGQWLDAVISGASMIPYVGDLAKAGKLPRYLKSVKRAIELAEKSAEAARLLVPGLKKLEQALDLIPKGANKALDELRLRVKAFLRRHAARIANDLLPDISRTFHFPPLYTVIHGNKRYTVKEASGRLGVPGKVKSHREASEKLQGKVSSSSGDHAGHLIGDQFGAPPAVGSWSKADAPRHMENLSRQNSIQNSGGGTYLALENQWAELLKGGTGVKVRVRDHFPEGASRPDFRTVEWTEIAPDGTETFRRLEFANTHTADWVTKKGAPVKGSRTQSGESPTVSEPQTNSVIDAKAHPAADHWFNRPPGTGPQ